LETRALEGKFPPLLYGMGKGRAPPAVSFSLGMRTSERWLDIAKRSDERAPSDVLPASVCAYLGADARFLLLLARQAAL